MSRKCHYFIERLNGLLYNKFRRKIMQVITGKIRGRRLEAPDSARPTLQRVKVSLFSMLNPYKINEGRVLDLFAGSGALGIECLSRGASQTVFVDQNHQATKIMASNLHGVSRSLYKIIESDYLSALKSLRGGEPFDVIFIAPPYDSHMLYSAIDILYRYNLVAPNGVIVVETEADKKMDLTHNEFVIVKDRTYGTARLTLLELKPTDN